MVELGESKIIKLFQARRNLIRARHGVIEGIEHSSVLCFVCFFLKKWYYLCKVVQIQSMVSVL